MATDSLREDLEDLHEDASKGGYSTRLLLQEIAAILDGTYERMTPIRRYQNPERAG